MSLSYNLKVGDRFELKQKTEQKVIQTIMGMDQTGNNTYDGTIEMRVLSSDANQIRLEAKMTQLKCHMKNFMNKTAVDSDGEQSEPSNKIVQAMMNRVFYVTLSRTGNVEKVEGVDNLWTGVNDLNVSTEEKDKVKSSIGQMINESSFRNGLGQAFVPYATKAVGNGDTWTTKNGIPMELPVISDLTWTLESATSSQAVVNGKGILRTVDKEKVVTLPGDMKAKVNLGGDQKVQSATSTKTGLPDKVIVDAKLSGVFLLLAGGILPFDVEVPSKIDTHTEYTFSRK